MHMVTIPGTDLRVSSICLGTALLGSEIDRASSFALLDQYVEMGGNFLDSAIIYANWLPRYEPSASEKTIGRWMRARNSRRSIVVGTKGAHPDFSAPEKPRLSKSDITYDLERSLANLGTDCIDLYWLHRDDPSRPVSEIIETLNSLAAKGYIRFFGCSNWRCDRIKAAQEFAVQNGLMGFSGDEMMWSLAKIKGEALPDPTLVFMDDALYHYHRQSGLAAMPYSSQANGLFHKLIAQDYDMEKVQISGQFLHEDNLERARRVARLANESGLSVAQVILGYLLAQPFTTIPIVGCQSLDDLRDSISSSDTVLSSEQVAFLERADRVNQ